MSPTQHNFALAEVVQKEGKHMKQTKAPMIAATQTRHTRQCTHLPF